MTCWNQWDLLHLHQGLLYRGVEDSSGLSLTQLIVPKEMMDLIFSQLHEQRYATHLDRDRTPPTIKRMFSWPGITKDTAMWCRKCQIYRRGKPGPGRDRTELAQFRVFRPMPIIFKQLSKVLDIEKNLNYHISSKKWWSCWEVQSNSISNVISLYRNQKDWDDQLPYVLAAYREPQMRKQLFMFIEK